MNSWNNFRDSCTNKRDLAIIDILSSTGIRVGELVKLNREDIDFHERQCVVFGKGNKERIVYFNARTKLHLQQYIDARTDNNPALFVSLYSPYTLNYQRCRSAYSETWTITFHVKGTSSQISPNSCYNGY